MYTHCFNRINNRVGHVFQVRYKGILVERNSYLLEFARDVVLNPVRAGMVKHMDKWPWSSYREMIGKRSAPDWLETTWLLAQFGIQSKRACHCIIYQYCGSGGGFSLRMV